MNVEPGNIPDHYIFMTTAIGSGESQIHRLIDPFFVVAAKYLSKNVRKGKIYLFLGNPDLIDSEREQGFCELTIAPPR